MAGKADWAAAGLPTEGTEAGKPRAGDLARTDVTTCRPDETVADVRERVDASGLHVAIVTNEQGVVFGIVRAEQFATADAGARIDAVMRPGPSTFRPNVPVGELATYLTEHDLGAAPITTSDGRLIGLLLRSDAVADGH